MGSRSSLPHCGLSDRATAITNMRVICQVEHEHWNRTVRVVR
jgi:hypothetical protein